MRFVLRFWVAQSLNWKQQRKQILSVVALLLVCVGLIGLIRRELSRRFAS